MSKPNLLSVSFSIGFYRNKRIRELRKKLSESVSKPIQFCELSPMLFQVLLAFCGENQIDGDLSGYTAEDLQEIFTVNHVPGLTTKEAAAILSAFNEVGLLEDGKIRSFAKFNRHLAEHEKIRKAKRKAAAYMHKQRLMEQKAKANAQTEPTRPEPAKPEKPAGATPKKQNPVARSISIKQMMENHPGRPEAANAPKDKFELELQRSEYKALKKELASLDREIAGFPARAAA